MIKTVIPFHYGQLLPFFSASLYWEQYFVFVLLCTIFFSKSFLTRYLPSSFHTTSMSHIYMSWSELYTHLSGAAVLNILLPSKKFYPIVLLFFLFISGYNHLCKKSRRTHLSNGERRRKTRMWRPDHEGHGGSCCLFLLLFFFSCSLFSDNPGPVFKLWDIWRRIQLLYEESERKPISPERPDKSQDCRYHHQIFGFAIQEGKLALKINRSLSSFLKAVKSLRGCVCSVNMIACSHK